MRVLAIIQSWDSQDQVRGFVTGWMEKLAEKVDQLAILALEQRQPATRPNIFVYSLGKENYQGPLRRFYYLWQWHRQIRKILALHSPQVIFTHMTPIYSVLAYPYSRAAGIPVFTWFLHPRASFITKLAHWLSTKVVSATAASYPYKKDKLVALGHGIDTNLFTPQFSARLNPPLLISVGRISPIKDYETIIKAAGLLKKSSGRAFQLAIIGGVINAEDRVYQERLRQLVIQLNLEDSVQLAPSQNQNNLVSWYQRASLHINATQPGSGDKVNLEAMACGTPSLMASPTFSETITPYQKQLLFHYQNPEDLSLKIMNFLALEENQRQELGKKLREAVIEHHNLDKLMTNLVALFKTP